MILQAAAEANIGPQWIVGVIFIMEILGGIFLEKKRRWLKTSDQNNLKDSPVCSHHGDMLERLARIEKGIDQKPILSRLDNISALLRDSREVKT